MNKATPCLNVRISDCLFALALYCAGLFFSVSQAVETDNPPIPSAAASASADQPDLPQAVRVALVDSGVNYLLPAINQRLARNSQGQLIGYDFWDMDAQPFDAHPDGHGAVQRHGTRTASIVLREAPFAQLVPYRYPRPDMRRMTDLIEHAAKHNVRVIGLPLGGNRKSEWSAFEIAAAAHPDILFVASAGNNGRDIDQQPVYPAALSLNNMLVVTSADDFVQTAQGVNWGRTSVDYMVPAERQPVLRFDGSAGLASGSSYAVPRVVALAARLLHEQPDLSMPKLVKRIRNLFANGVLPRQIGQGYLYDPQLNELDNIEVSEPRVWSSKPIIKYGGNGADTDERLVGVALDVFVLDDQWVPMAARVLDEAQSILAACGIQIITDGLQVVTGPDYLKDLETGAAKTLMDAIRTGHRRVAVLFARDTRMNMPFDAEAFGRGNTRSRSWLTNSVWLTLALEDRGIALAHELFHVLVNSGEHSTDPGNLMLARTTGDNRRLSMEQCQAVRAQALLSELGREESVQ